MLILVTWYCHRIFMYCGRVHSIYAFNFNGWVERSETRMIKG